MVDRIIVLNDGAISESGTYEELISRDGDFSKFLQQHIMEDAEEGEDPEGLSNIYRPSYKATMHILDLKKHTIDPLKNCIMFSYKYMYTP